MKSPSFALMGGTDLKLGSHTRPGAPVMRVRAFSLTGGMEVTTKTPTRNEVTAGQGPG